ncbi:MAG TPA: Fic family protein, partial [Burkholderiales bacterium]|nr:Fic family protein [Burkholderiales bacterium]
FMETLMQPERLRARVLIWAEEEIRLGTLPARADRLLEVFLYRGEIPRSDIASVLGAPERTARRVTSALLKRGVLTSASPKAPLQLAFPAALAARWMPGLFPERPA